MSTTPEPMTEERLALIQARFDRFVYKAEANDDVCVLLAEVRRLKEKLYTTEQIAQGFSDRLGRSVHAGMAHLAHAAQLRDVLQKIRTARTEGGCSTGEAMAKTEAWARDALALIPMAALACQTARSKVVEAAREFVEARRDRIKPLADGFAANLEIAVDAYHAAAAKEGQP